MSGWFLNLRTGTKFLVVFGAVLASLLIVAATAYVSQERSRAAIRRIYEVQFANVDDLGVMTSRENNVRGTMFKMMLMDQRAEWEREHATILELELEVRSRLNALIERNRNNEELSRQLRQIDDALEGYVDLRENRVLPALYSGDRETALAFSLDEQKNVIGSIREISYKLMDDAEAAAAAAVDDAERQAVLAELVFVAMTVLAVGVGVSGMVLLTRSIAGPMLRVAEAAGRVAQGDLTCSVDASSRSDEVGILQDTVRRMVENLRSITKEIGDGVAVLASASNEISASSTQVATGAAETASAISETTTTVEEVKQTANVASQKAKVVSDSSSRANESAREGAGAVQDMQAGMRHIHEQMGSIAGSITRLSEQGQSIGGIIATVDDISEQSNLLAVNAAIEAAKAGEQGRGFGVVAQEMRSLAEQSKEATKQIRQILNDIQRGVSAAGMATEQGTRSAESGLKLSEEAGSMIDLLVQAVTESAQAAMQIAASSQQQLAGMDQVASAMENIRDAGEQNVAASRQVEDSARALHDLGQTLREAVSKFKV